MRNEKGTGCAFFCATETEYPLHRIYRHKKKDTSLAGEMSFLHPQF